MGDFEQYFAFPCEFEIAGFNCVCYRQRTETELDPTRKIEGVQYPVIIAEQAWLIKDLVCGKEHYSLVRYSG